MESILTPAHRLYSSSPNFAFLLGRITVETEIAQVWGEKKILKEGISNLALAGEVIIFPIAFSVLVSPAFCYFSLFPFVLFLFCFLLFCRV